MPNYTPLGWVFLAWSIVTIALAMLLIYRSIVSMKEDDQLFLDAAESHFEKEQQGVILRLNTIKPYITGLVISSACLMATMLGLLVYRIVTAA